MTFDLITGGIIGLLATGAMAWLLFTIYLLTGLARLTGRGVLATARWWRRRGTPGAWRCDDCGRGLDTCPCPPVPAWAKQRGGDA